MDTLYYPNLINTGDTVRISPKDPVPEKLRDYVGMEGVVTFMVFYDDELLYVENEATGQKTYARASHVEKVKGKYDALPA